MVVRLQAEASSHSRHIHSIVGSFTTMLAIMTGSGALGVLGLRQDDGPGAA